MRNENAPLRRVSRKRAAPQAQGGTASNVESSPSKGLEARSVPLEKSQCENRAKVDSEDIEIYVSEEDRRRDRSAAHPDVDEVTPPGVLICIQ
jgi:hypothetical protein